MKNDIHVGDLVMMVYTDNDLLCEHAKAFIGIPMIVQGLTFDSLHCEECFCRWQSVHIARLDRRVALKVSWLKKIPPLATDETITEQERITA